MGLRLAPYKLVKAWKYLIHYGPKEFFIRVRDRMEKEDVPYADWYEKHRASDGELARQREEYEKLRAAAQSDGAACALPLFSVLVPAYRTPELFLRELIESVLSQTYGKLELVIADASDDDSVRKIAGEYREKDRRVVLVPVPENEGIAQNTNAAAAAAKGDYLAFCDHDDLLSPDALFEMARAVRETGADLLYSDEDKVTADRKKYYQPHFKPEFNLDLLRSNNYITHLTVIRKDLFDGLGGLRAEFNGAQDYDLVLRASEKAEKIARIPKILYHWRTHESSTADNPMSKQYAYDAGKRAIEEHLKRTGTPGEVEELKDFGFYRVRYPVRSESLVSVIIPNKDHADVLKSCLAALFSADHTNIEVLIVENNSAEEKTFAYYKELETDPRIRILRYEDGFNYAAINNFAAREAKGEYLLFLNNDVRGSIDPGWLSEMLGVCQRPDVGAVGARLYYPDDTIQHAGCVVGLGGVAGALFVGMKRNRTGYLHKAAILQDLSAVTAACMMMRADVFREAGGFTEELAVAFNDIDLCLKAGSLGYRIVYDPYAELYHDESKSRGAEDTMAKVKRFNREIDCMKERWAEILEKGDPNYNPNLSLKKWNYSLRP